MINKEEILEILTTKVSEALRVKKFHAKGGKTIHKKGRNAGEVKKLTGKNKVKLRMQGKKLKRTLKSKGSGAKKRANFKRELAMKKRGN